MASGPARFEAARLLWMGAHHPGARVPLPSPTWVDRAKAETLRKHASQAIFTLEHSPPGRRIAELERPAKQRQREGGDHGR